MLYYLAIQMKKLALFLSILFSLLCINGQVVTIGSGNSTNTSIPSVLSQNYSYSQQIYTATEVGDAAPICGISLWKTSTETIYRYVTIYLGHTQQTQFTSNTNWIPIGELTLVFSGIVKFLPNAWSYIGFDTPFQYDGADGNLVVAFDDNTQIKETSQTFKVFSTPNGTIHNSSDVNNPNPSSPPAGTRLNVRNQIKIHKCAPTLMSNTSINTCDLLYSDPGGMGDYSPNQTFTQVITSSTPNNRLEFHFLEFDLANGDTLWIYNGNGTNAPLIGIFGAFVSPFNFTSSGSSLTFKFKSDNSVESAGWLAQILCRSCTPVSISTGSPCQPDPNSITGYAAKPFCTDENPYGIEYPSGTSGSTSSYISAPACLGATPAPAWYFMRISDPGDILVYISQTSTYGGGLDVDFACWGPFYADNQQDFMQRWCCGEYILHDGYVPSHRPPNGDHTNDMGGYPVSNLIDCSYRADATEWAFIPNAQTGQYYILLITNYSQQPGTISFNTVSQFTTGSTDCSLLASVTSNGQVCEGGTIQLYSNNNQPNITYTWNGPNGFTSTLTNPVITNATPANSGTYYLTITNQAGNSSTDSTQVVVYPNPSATYTITDTYCDQNNGRFEVTLSGGTPPYQYNWSHGGNNAQAFNLEEGIYSCTITDDHGCTTSIQDTIHEIFSIEITGIIGHRETCNQQNGSIGITFAGESAPYQYQWNSAGGFSGNEITQLASDYYFITVTDQYGCTDTTSVEVSGVDFTTSVLETTPSYCEQNNGTVTLSLTGDLENPYINWGPIVHHNELDAFNLSSGIYTIYVEDYGCIDTVIFEIEGTPKPVACFSFSPSGIIMTDQLINFYNCSYKGDSYEWDFGDGNNYDGFNAQHQYKSTGNYTVSLLASNQYDCTDSISALIIVFDEVTVHIPNSFTPNQDGVNDLFIPIFTSVSETGYQLSIFNRWGEVIFQTTNPADGWDGTHRNKEVPPGTYSYLVSFQNLNGKQFQRAGLIYLIR